MKKILTIACLAAATSLSYAQGFVNFGNSSTTLISAGGTATPGSSTSGFVFALFVAPSGTVAADFTNPVDVNDNRFQLAGAYNVNHATSVGRLATTAGQAVVSGTPGGSTVDFIIRGWSASAGATWAEALAAWNGGAGATMYLGSSRIGNNVILGDGGGIPTPSLFGVGGNQVGGFNLTLYPVPEPSSMALAGLGAASLLIFRRRK